MDWSGTLVVSGRDQIDSGDDKDASFNDPDYLEIIHRNEGLFMDLENTVFFVTEEELVLDNMTR